MLSSIFNSERNYFIHILAFILLTISTYLLMNITGFKIKEKNTSEGLYSNDVRGKNQLMKTIWSGKNPDIIFVGSSTTKYHVSTNLFKSRNIRTFNYGLESHFFTAYPSMIDNAIKAKPKVIAISIDGPELFYPLLSVEAAFNPGVNINLKNLGFFTHHYFHHLNYFIETRLILRMLKVYIKQLNYFMMNGHIITDTIQSAYNRFNPALATSRVKTENHKSVMNKQYIDCKPIGSIADAAFGCVDGDGIILGNEKSLSYENFNKKNEYDDQKYNYVFVSILNDMLDKIRSADIIPVIIFLPQFELSVMNQNLIKKTLHADIIDMTQFRIPKDGWYNGGHFNAKGRYIYSSQLARQIKPLVVRS